MTTIQQGIGTSYYGQLRVLSGGQAPGGHTALYGSFGKCLKYIFVCFKMMLYILVIYLIKKAEQQDHPYFKICALFRSLHLMS